MGKKKTMLMSKEDVCVCTPSSSWIPFQNLSQNSNFDHNKHMMFQNMSARKLAAHLYHNSFPICNQSPCHIPHNRCYTSPHQTEGGSDGLNVEAAAPSGLLLPTLRVRNSFHHSTAESDISVRALKSVVDNERRRRKELERLNRKLEHEIDEAKLLFYSTSIELEKGKRSCKFMEDLCDKFAKELLYCQSEMKSFKPRRTLKELKVTCRMAEAWLENRTESNYQARGRFIPGEELLSSSPEERSFYRRSSESFLLNVPGNQIPSHEENSTENDLSCFEQHKWITSRKDTTRSSNGTQKCSDIKSHFIGTEKQQSLASKSNKASLETYLLQARKRPQPQHCTFSSGCSKSQNDRRLP